MRAHVGDTDQGGKQPRLGVQKHLPDVRPLEHPEARTRLIRPETLNRLLALIIVLPEARSLDSVVEAEPNEGCGRHGDQAGGEVEGLPRVPSRRVDMAEGIRQYGRNHGRCRVGDEPGAHTERLFGTTVPSGGQHGEHGDVGGFYVSFAYAGAVSRFTHLQRDLAGTDTPAARAHWSQQPYTPQRYPSRKRKQS